MDAGHASGICLLPYDLLLDILRRFPGRTLAASRCVCRGWRDIVDAHALLLPHVFPREFPGVFAAYKGYDPSFALFGPSRDADAVQPGYRRLFWDHWDRSVKHHCNGLLLVTGDTLSKNPYVCNPATSRYARLPCPPPPPSPWQCSTQGMFLAFDPAVSRHHEVFFLPTENLFRSQAAGSASRQSNPNLPAAKGTKRKVLHVLVFSSRTGQWENRQFTPGPCASIHLYDVVNAPRAKDERTWWTAEYWRSSLYVHCHSNVLMVLRCAHGTYDMVQLPGHLDDRERLYRGALPTRYLASCERGIRYAMINDLQLEVWELMELADDGLGWTLAHEADLGEHDRTMSYLRNKSRLQPKMQWAVVESSKDSITLFEEYSDAESNDESDDGTGNDEDEEDSCDEDYETQGEEEEEQYSDDGTLGEEEEERHNDVETQGEEEEEHYNDDETRSEEEEEQYNDDDETHSEEEEEQYSDHGTTSEEEEEQDNYEDEEHGSSDSSDYSWNSDQQNFIDFDNSKIADEHVWGWGCRIVGFHPYKDVLLLKFSDTVVAYHLHTSRVQYLGYMYPHKHHQQAREVYVAFPYRPCYVDALPSRKMSGSS